MEWTESEDLNNDRCSTASSSSNPGEPGGQPVNQSSGYFSKKSHTAQYDQTGGMHISNTSTNLDSMSDGEISDYSLHDTDEEEFSATTEHANGMNQYIEHVKPVKILYIIDFHSTHFMYSF